MARKTRSNIRKERRRRGHIESPKTGRRKTGRNKKGKGK